MSSPQRAAAWLLCDVGSSSVRCTAIYGADAASPRPAVLAHARQPVHLSDDGSFEPLALEATVRAAVHDCAAALPPGAHAARLLLTSVAATLVGLDAAGAPVTRLLTYANRHALAPRIAAQLQATVDEAAHWGRTGTPLHAAYAPVLAQLPGDGGPRPQLWTSLSGFLLSRWAGLPAASVGMSVSEAAWAGLLDARTLRYDAGACHAAGIDAGCLPPVRDAEWSLCVPPRALEQCGLLPAGAADAAVTMALALGDGAAASLGAAALATEALAGDRAGHPATAATADELSLLLPPLAPSLLCISVGTSAALRVVLPRARLLASLCSCDGGGGGGSGGSGASGSAVRGDSCAGCSKPRLSASGLFVYALSDNLALLGGALTDGGALLSTIAGLAAAGAGAAPLGDADDSAAHVSEGAHAGEPALAAGDRAADGAPVSVEVAPTSALCLPFWSGERSTGWDARAKGAFLGLDHANTTLPHLLHAAMDAVAWRLRVIYERLCALAPEAAALPIAVCGGAVQLSYNPVWAHILAAALGRPLLLQGDCQPATALEATSFGAAVFHAALHGHEEEDPAPLGAPPSCAAHATWVLPTAASISRYQAGFARHVRVYDLLAGLAL